MNTNKFLVSILSILVLIFSPSCEKDNDNDNNNDVNAPMTYSFDRGGESTVSFSGQTARLEMAEELMNALNSESSTKDLLNQMFNDGTGFSNDILNTSGKNIAGKTAISSVASATVKIQFDNFINEFVDDVIPNFSNTASPGMAGTIGTRHVSSKGLEYNQAFGKGLIGAMCVDQIVNNYLTQTKIGDNVDNDASNLSAGEYTSMEHHWDEAFGYIYGREEDETSPMLGVGVLYNKYLNKVNSSNEPGIATDIYDAFKLGRAAIVASNSDVRYNQAEILRKKVSRVIAHKASDYLFEGAAKMSEGDWAGCLHSLSEGYGFILSLQFTYNDNGVPYFSNSEVNDMLDQLMEGNGFWDRSTTELEEMGNQILSVL